jgi:nucleoside-diphosphate-sugar epimerase/glyoxylase-like metal-dependent hydrolase (beta-lactamase superfamily II)
VNKTVLVTGATGFLGGHLARDLAADGFDVRGLGRNTIRGVQLEADGISFFPVDLSSREAFRRACRGVDVVVHAAALSTAWAAPSEYRRVNVDGTAAVLQAAQVAGVRRIVHISTPAVLSRFADQFDLTEEAPIPEAHTSDYGGSKAAAERLVSAVSEVETVIVRPKAIYGPGDTALLPRLLDAASRGRLRIVGDGNTVTHLTHVSDVVRALRLMIESEHVSKIYHVAGPEPVRLWDMVTELLPRLGLAPAVGRVSVERAMRAARMIEAVWRTLRLRGEPPLTRYKVSTVAYSQTLDASRARDELGFVARVSAAEGLEEVVAAIIDPETSSPVRPVTAPESTARASLSVAVAGTVHPPGWTVGRRSLRRTTLPVLVGVVRHPTRGVVLVDSGYGRRSPGGGSVWWSLYRWLLRPRPVALKEALAACGVDIKDVTSVVLSHFDPDHCGGLEELPWAQVICSAAGWEDVAAHLVGSWRRRIPPHAIPADLAGRIRLLDVRTDRNAVDIFGDGSVAAVPLDGHTPGHIGVRVTDRDGTHYLLCGDAVWGIRELDGGTGGVASLVARDRAAAAKARADVKRATQADPALVVVPSHCSEMAELLLGPDWLPPMTHTRVSPVGPANEGTRHA